MSEEMYDRVLANPKFAELTSSRNRFSWTLSIIVLLAYYAFVLTVAFKPELLQSPLAGGMTLSIGLAVGLVLTIFCFAMTGLYVRRANSRYDTLNRLLIEEAAQ
ncbi:MAG TPA: DUF485 domain-containing protein [Azospirillum sp.]|nr:DUF485 domain-containing protein [Azospirillum sp.]